MPSQSLDALLHLRQELEIELYSLPANHSNLAKTYDRLTGALYEQKKIKDVLKNMMQCYSMNSKY